MMAPRELLPVLHRLSEVLLRLERAEREKAEAASHGQHKLLNPILTEEQALFLELRGLEQKRLSLLKGAGLEKATLRQLLEQEDQEGKELLSPVFEELDQAARQLKMTKESADRILKVRLRQMEHLLGASGSPQYDEYG